MYCDLRKHECGLPPGHHRTSDMLACRLGCFRSGVLGRTTKNQSPSIIKKQAFVSGSFFSVNILVCCPCCLHVSE